VVGCLHSGGSDAETKEARIETGEPLFDLCVLKKIRLDNLFELRILHAGSRSSDGLNKPYTRIAPTFAQYTLADRTRGAKQKNLHVTYFLAGVMLETGKSQWASKISKRRCSSRW
jgi:hypothetical protein